LYAALVPPQLKVEFLAVWVSINPEEENSHAQDPSKF
jgi:hypothetical protein